MDRDVFGAYMMELMLVLKFSLYILMISHAQRSSYIKYLIKFIAEKSQLLFVFGINVPLPLVGSQEEKYLIISKSMRLMNGDQREMFDAMRQKFAVEQKARDEEIEKKVAAEEAANEAR